MRPSERDSAALTVPDPSPSTPGRDEASSVDHSGLDDVYLTAAHAYQALSPHRRDIVELASRPQFRAAVDAARKDLAAENAELTEALAEALKQMKLIGDAGEAAIARVTAERDQARAELAQLRSPVFLPARRGSDD